ncbi:MAG: 3-hydroxyacyl-CoA dehydrogenase/enoyl-CoA hydratase family protein [bacterium]|nr:3-hydroxyacyl-CoA dehydrogenase/enoyl-CoA hydratase family protein [bacterium]
MMQRIEKVAVIGSGIMGGGIAALCASAAIPTLLLDIVPFDLTAEETKNPEARNSIAQAGLEATIKAKPALFPDKKNDLRYIDIGNLEDDFQSIAHCDLIIEAIVENLDIKQKLFARIDAIRKPGAIIASNTSGLPLVKMVEGRSKEFKEHFLIAHFFNPVRYMKLLEIVPGPDTNPGLLDWFTGWSEQTLGKGIAIARDTPNFIGNRIGMGLLCKAFQLMDEEKDSISIPEFDALFGPAFGMPKTAVFALADLVGLDTIGHLTENSFQLLPNDEARDIFRLPAFVSGMIKKNMLGNKTKESGGFYKSEFDPGTFKKKKKVLNINSGHHVDFDRKQKPEILSRAREAGSLAEKQRMLLFDSNPLSQAAWKLAAFVLIYSANRVPEIAGSIVEIDNAMRWGFTLEAGPFQTWDNLGLKDSVEKMKADGFSIPVKIEEMLARGHTSFYRVENGKELYYDFESGSYLAVPVSSNVISLKTLKADNKEVLSNNSASLIDLGDDIFCVEFHTKMNALNNEIIEFMAEADSFVRENGAGMVIGSQAPGFPGAFSAGADLGYMLNLAKNKKWGEIESFIKKAQDGVMGARYAPYPVVAAPFGMTLGGGCEICLASDRVVAHSELIMGLVEIGSGLLPAGGGCTNLWRKFIESVPPAVAISDYAAFFLPVIMSIGQAKVSLSAAQARNSGFLGPKDRIIANRDHLIGEAKKEALKLVSDGYRPPAKTDIPVMGQEARGILNAELFNMAEGGFITPHMKAVTLKIAYVISGGEARQGMPVSEDYMLRLEREAFVELWQTENTQKMAEHMLAKGKPLML